MILAGSLYRKKSLELIELDKKELNFFSIFLVAHPSPVEKLDVYNQSNGLIIEWTKAFRYVNLLYSLRCQKLGTSVLKPYRCCVRVRLPYGISPFYSEVCKASQNKGASHIASYPDFLKLADHYKHTDIVYISLQSCE